MTTTLVHQEDNAHLSQAQVRVLRALYAVGVPRAAGELTNDKVIAPTVRILQCLIDGGLVSSEIAHASAPGRPHPIYALTERGKAVAAELDEDA